MLAKYLNHNGRIQMLPPEGVSFSSGLKPAIYTLMFDEEKLQYYLMESEPYKIGKMYGNIEAMSDKIIKTFMDRKDADTGVLMVGEKGCGKTQLAKLVISKVVGMGLPVVLINSSYHGTGFMHMMGSFGQDVAVMFDEYEKVYNKHEMQEAMVSYFDGVVSSGGGRRLNLVTINDEMRVSDYLKNRPGRFFYKLDYNGVDTSVIVEFCKDHGVSNEDMDCIIRVAGMVTGFSFDMLKAIIEETKRYGFGVKEALEHLNIRPTRAGDKPFRVLSIVHEKLGVCKSERRIVMKGSGQFRLFINVDCQWDYAEWDKVYDISNDDYGLSIKDDHSGVDLYLSSKDLVQINSGGIEVYEKFGFTFTMEPVEKSLRDWRELI